MWFCGTCGFVVHGVGATQGGHFPHGQLCYKGSFSLDYTGVLYCGLNLKCSPQAPILSTESPGGGSVWKVVEPLRYVAQLAKQTGEYASGGCACLWFWSSFLLHEQPKSEQHFLLEILPPQMEPPEALL